MTQVFSKQLQPIYDKPLVYYPLSTLMLSGIKDVLIISTPQDTPNFEALLGDGSKFGVNISYKIQHKPGGLPEAFTVGEEFIGNDQVCLILGDNIFYGKLDFLRKGIKNNQGGTIFAYRVDHPESYGVVELSKKDEVLSIEEKPKEPKSNFAIPGLYIFNKDVVEYSKSLEPSARGELEITDLHKKYLEMNKLNVERIGRGIAWLDTGTPENLIEAGAFIHAIEKRQGMKIACLEEIALMNDFISLERYEEIISQLPKCDYKNYCQKILKDYK
jgi:glucose-1-phosphate thymidylyltransferase